MDDNVRCSTRITDALRELVMHDEKIFLTGLVSAR